MAKTATPVKEVSIIARVEFRSDVRKVVYQVLSSNGNDKYEVHMFNGKACYCSCPSTRGCYHRDGCEAHEAARTEARKQQPTEEEINAKRAAMLAIYDMDYLTY